MALRCLTQHFQPDKVNGALWSQVILIQKSTNAGMKCFICECKFPQAGITFHNFPKNESRRRIWLSSIYNASEKQDKISENNRVCSRHFTPDSFWKGHGRKILKNNAVPTLNLIGGGEKDLIEVCDHNYFSKRKRKPQQSFRNVPEGSIPSMFEAIYVEPTVPIEPFSEVEVAIIIEDDSVVWEYEDKEDSNTSHTSTSDPLSCSSFPVALGSERTTVTHRPLEYSRHDHSYNVTLHESLRQCTAELKRKTNSLKKCSNKLKSAKKQAGRLRRKVQMLKDLVTELKIANSCKKK